MDFVLWYNSRGKSLKNVQTVPSNNLSYSDSWPIYRSSNPKLIEKLYICFWLIWHFLLSMRYECIIISRFVLSADKKTEMDKTLTRYMIRLHKKHMWNVIRVSKTWHFFLFFDIWVCKDMGPADWVLSIPPCFFDIFMCVCFCVTCLMIG